MVIEVNHFVADNDPEETRWSKFEDAARHENRLKFARWATLYMDENHAARRVDELSLQDWVEFLAAMKSAVDRSTFTVD